MSTNQQKSQQQGQQRATQASTTPGNAGAEQRSENLLPPGDDDDGRYDVAEEVNADVQSDAARRVGKAPAGATAQAMGAALQGDDEAGKIKP